MRCSSESHESHSVVLAGTGVPLANCPGPPDASSVSPTTTETCGLVRLPEEVAFELSKNHRQSATKAAARRSALLASGVSSRSYLGVAAERAASTTAPSSGERCAESSRLPSMVSERWTSEGCDGASGPSSVASARSRQTLIAAAVSRTDKAASAGVSSTSWAA
jgi:hypothetical protein